MSKLVPPHGSDALIPLLAPEAEIAEELKRASTLRKVPMSSRETSDFIMLAMGAYTPLAGFMSKADWHGVCADMKLASGLFWPIPITLSATRELADSIAVGETVALVDQDSGEIMGMLDVSAPTTRSIRARRR
jgi:sulfate adenylyltransferase